MKKNMFILTLLFVATSLFAQGYTSAPTYEWKSVSGSHTATANSTMSSTIGTSPYASTIYAVGAESPSGSAPAGGPHKAGIGGPGQTGTGGNEPVITPIGDGLWVLLVLAAAYAVFTAVRRRRVEQL